MGAMEIGTKLVELCREGRNLDAIDALYADDVVSIEASAPPAGGDRKMEGIEAIRGKNEWWAENHEVHGASVAGPFPNGDDRFAVHFKYDVTSKPMGGQRFQMEEVALYTVQDGKIAREEFFYSM